MKKTVFGIALLAILAVLVMSATANEVYFVPQDSSCDPSETVTVWVMANITHAPGSMDLTKWGGFQVNVTYLVNIGNVTEVTKNETGNPYNCDYWGWHRYGDTIWVTGAYDDPCAPFGVYKLAELTIEGVNQGVTPLAFAFEQPRKSNIFDDLGGDLPDQLWTDGTFTCGNPPPVVTFTKPLPEGWNLISLPLTATDNSVGTVLSGVTQNAVKRYDATTKLFEEATTMDPGVGYFVHVTESGGSTWSYQGSPVTSTNPGLTSGLNMIGAPNCTMDVSAAMGSADYRYVARWNAAAQEYEVYNPLAPSVFHGFTEMAAGEGYFVSAKSDCALNINCPG